MITDKRLLLVFVIFSAKATSTPVSPIVPYFLLFGTLIFMYGWVKPTLE
jgi:hypothetical protein